MKNIKAYAPKRGIPSGCDNCSPSPHAFQACFLEAKEQQGILLCEDCLFKALNLIDKKRAKLACQRTLRQFGKRMGTKKVEKSS